MTIGNFIWGCWLIFVGYWFINFRAVKETAEREEFKDWKDRLVQFILMFLAFSLLVDFNYYAPVYPFTLVLLPQTISVAVIGCVVCLLGLVGAIWARRTIAGNWSSNVTFKKGHELIQRGPYQYVRHPIYTGILLMFLGSAISIGRLGGLLGLFVLFLAFWLKLRKEEKLMLKHFPGQYEEYMKRVKRLIPYIF